LSRTFVDVVVICWYGVIQNDTLLLVAEMKSLENLKVKIVED